MCAFRLHNFLLDCNEEFDEFTGTKVPVGIGYQRSTEHRRRDGEQQGFDDNVYYQDMLQMEDVSRRRVGSCPVRDHATMVIRSQLETRPLPGDLGHGI